MKAFLLLCVVAAAAPAASAQGRSVQGLAWLSGCWEQRDAEGLFQEFWTRPEGGTILQTGRMTSGGKTLFYETIQIKDAGDALSALVTINGRRRVDFELLEFAPDRISFRTPAAAPEERLTYERVSKDRLKVSIEKPKKSAERFDLRRADCDQALFGAPGRAPR